MKNQDIPAISIRQPWAELILLGKKTIEIRDWTSSYRGRIFIHTGKMADGYRHIDYGMTDVFRGGYIGLVELGAILEFTPNSWEQWRKKHLSDSPYKSGSYAWILRNPKRLTMPIPAPGKLGIFYPEPAIQKLLQEDLFNNF